MKSQAYRMALLFDFYGDVLTPRQKEFYDLYYNEDLSLAEIAENYGITRQGVRDVIVRAADTLAGLEEGADLASADLQAAAAAYLTDTVGLSAQQVEDLQALLSGAAGAEAAA